MASRFRALGRYELICELAKSPLGTLWAAQPTSAGADSPLVSIRRVRTAGVLDAKEIDRLSEAAWWSLEVQHPNICPVLDVVMTEDELGVVAEYHEGEVLRSLLRLASFKRRAIAGAAALSITLDVLEALRFAHEQAQRLTDGSSFVCGGFVPDSVWVALDGRARLLDLGVAGIASTVPSIAHHPDMAGYAAPEVLDRNAEIDLRSDLFAVGVMLWEMLTGKRLFVGSSPEAVAERVRAGSIPRIDDPRAATGADLPKGLAEFVARALQRDPAQRFQRPSEMIDALREAAQLSQGANTDVVQNIQDLASNSLSSRRKVIGRAVQPENALRAAALRSEIRGPAAAQPRAAPAGAASRKRRRTPTLIGVAPGAQKPGRESAATPSAQKPGRESAATPSAQKPGRESATAPIKNTPAPVATARPLEQPAATALPVRTPFVAPPIAQPPNAVLERSARPRGSRKPTLIGVPPALPPTLAVSPIVEVAPVAPPPFSASPQITEVRSSTSSPDTARVVVHALTGSMPPADAGREHRETLSGVAPAVNPLAGDSHAPRREPPSFPTQTASSPSKARADIASATTSMRSDRVRKRTLLGMPSPFQSPATNAPAASLTRAPNPLAAARLPMDDLDAPTVARVTSPFALNQPQVPAEGFDDDHPSGEEETHVYRRPEDLTEVETLTASSAASLPAHKTPLQPFSVVQTPVLRLGTEASHPASTEAGAIARSASPLSANTAPLGGPPPFPISSAKPPALSLPSGSGMPPLPGAAPSLPLSSAMPPLPAAAPSLPLSSAMPPFPASAPSLPVGYAMPPLPAAGPPPFASSAPKPFSAHAPPAFVSQDVALSAKSTVAGFPPPPPPVRESTDAPPPPNAQAGLNAAQGAASSPEAAAAPPLLFDRSIDDGEDFGAPIPSQNPERARRARVLVVSVLGAMLVLLVVGVLVSQLRGRSNTEPSHEAASARIASSAVPVRAPESAAVMPTPPASTLATVTPAPSAEASPPSSAEAVPSSSAENSDSPLSKPKAPAQRVEKPAQKPEAPNTANPSGRKRKYVPQGI